MDIVYWEDNLGEEPKDYAYESQKTSASSPACFVSTEVAAPLSPPPPALL